MDKKKRTWGAHKASATRLKGQIENIVASVEPSIPQLKTLRTSLEKKLEVIKKLDEEIADLKEDETEMTAEVEQADVYKEMVYSALLKADSCLMASLSTSALVETPPGTFQTQCGEAPTLTF